MGTTTLVKREHEPLVDSEHESSGIGRAAAVPMSMLRIYLRRRTARRQPGLRGWFVRKPVTHFLVEEALKIGVSYGTVTLGHFGFVQDARRVEYTNPELPFDRLPTCVELVADKAVLDAFVEAFAHELRDAILVRLDGIAYTLLTLDE